MLEGVNGIGQHDVEGAQHGNTLSSGTKHLTLNFGAPTRQYTYLDAFAPGLLYNDIFYTIYGATIAFTPEAKGFVISDVKANGTELTPAENGQYWCQVIGDVVITATLTSKSDVNKDGEITIADVTALVDIILGKDAETTLYDHEAADVNGDNTITIADVTALVDIILGK